MVKLLSAIQSLVESSNVLSGLGLSARPDWARWLLYGFSWIGYPSLLMDFHRWWSKKMSSLGGQTFKKSFNLHLNGVQSPGKKSVF